MPTVSAIDALEARILSYGNTVMYNPAFSWSQPLTFIFDEPTRPARPEFNDNWIRENVMGAGWTPCRVSCRICARDREYAKQEYDKKYGLCTHKAANEAWRHSWARVWHNLGVAHTAAVFMKEAHWDDSEKRFTNEQQLIAYTQ